MVTVDGPGVYDLDVRDYHRDPVPGGSLSSSGARKLLPPSCPAKFREWLEHGEEPNETFERGHAAHHEVLGTGPEIVVVKHPTWNRKAARDERDEARARGAVPVLEHQADQVRAMAEVLRGHPIAGPLLDPAYGKTEQTLVWWDAEFGIWRRAMLDYLPDQYRDRRLIVADYKTCDSAEPAAIARAIANYRYHQQVDWYGSGLVALELESAGPPAVVLVFQETTRPYVVTVVELKRSALDIGRTRNRKAMDIYRQCRATGVWPGYADDVVSVGVPGWAEYQHQDAELSGAFEIGVSA